MINSKEDLIRFLNEDRISLGKQYKKPKFLSDEVWRFQIALRYREYYSNCSKGIIAKFFKMYWTYRHHRLSVKLGLQVPPNVCDSGLHINHWGLLVISPEAKIGKNFDVHQGVNIGINIDPGKAPKIGDNVFCGPGVKIYGDIEIADNIAIAAGSVVTKSFFTPNITIGGVPAKIINNSKGNPYILGNCETGQ